MTVLQAPGWQSCSRAAVREGDEVLDGSGGPLPWTALTCREKDRAEIQAALAAMRDALAAVSTVAVIAAQCALVSAELLDETVTLLREPQEPSACQVAGREQAPHG